MRERIAAAAALLAAAFISAALCGACSGALAVLAETDAALAATRRTRSDGGVRLASGDCCLACGCIPVAICFGCLAEAVFEVASWRNAAVLGGTVLAPRAAVSFLTLRVAACSEARAAEIFFLSACLAEPAEFGREAAEVRAFDFAPRPALVAPWGLTANARAEAFRFVLGSAAERLGAFAFDALTYFACFGLDIFTVFLTDAMISALLILLPRSGDGAETHGRSDLRRSKKSELQPYCRDETDAPRR